MKCPRGLAVLAVGGIAVVALATPAEAHSGETPPGTATRPVLSRAEAAAYAPMNYLGFSGTYAAPVADPWHPGPIRVEGRRPDFMVGARAGVHGVTHTSVQAAVNAAFRAGGTARRYIGIRPGTYTGTVFIPAGGPPLT
ncbi:MAG: pectinesterase, partial [Mycobacteriales bacterium]